MRLVEIKYFNGLIYNKSCFDQAARSKLGTYGKLIEMSKMVTI